MTREPDSPSGSLEAAPPLAPGLRVGPRAEAEVRYELAADGRTHRGGDTVLPVFADRWRAGEHIEVLYPPHRNYDSVIVSTQST